jgi:hypothetical protein
MTFLHPALLYLLPLAAIPILLHLLTLHRLKTVELSTFRFLFDSYVQQRRRMQFLEALLAMLRTLFLLLLVLLICRPVVQQWAGLFQGSSGREVILLVDCSASMNARTGGVPALERARSAARTVTERLVPEDRVTLVRVVSQPEQVFSRFSNDAAAIGDRIDGLKGSSSRANWFAALTQVFAGPDAPKHGNALVYLFTDCQASGWREARSQGLERVVPAGTQVVVVNVGSTEPIHNLAVAGDPPPRQPAIIGLPLVLQPHVVNHSKSETADVTLSVLIDDKEVARQALTLKPGENATRKVTYLPSAPGVHRGRFEIAAKAPDRFPDDDAYLFTLAVVPRVKVLLVNGFAAPDPFESESLYLRAALTANPDGAEVLPTAPPAPKPGALEPSRELARALEVHEVVEAGLNAESLRDASVVILANCGGLNGQQFEWLRGFVNGGGGLLVFPGDRVNPQVYNTQFFPVPGPQGERLTAATIGAIEGDPEKVETFERLAVIDFAHPALSVFDDPEARYLRTPRFYRRFKLTLPEKREKTWPLAEFASGAPALVESRLGDGTVLLAAFPANSKWGNLPLKPEFVPLLLRLVAHAEHRPEVEGPAVVPPDGVAEIAAAATWAPLTGTVTEPDSGPVAPLTFQRSGSRFLATFDHTAERGYYTVEVKGTGQGRSATVAFAVNLAPEESDFSTLTESQLADLLPTAKVTVVDASAEAQQLHGTLGNEREVWRPLIWVLFVIISVEFLLATLRGGRRPGEEEATVAERIQQINPGTWVGRMTGAARRPGE